MRTDNLDVVKLLEYNKWSNSKYLDYCTTLDDTMLGKEYLDYPNSIRKILCHILEVNWYWMTRITTKDYSDDINPDNLSKEDLLDKIREYDGLILEFSKNNDLDTKEIIQWNKVDKPVESSIENILFNFVTHSAYHRGQLAIFLRLLGFETIEETDFNPFIYFLGQ